MMLARASAIERYASSALSASALPITASMPKWTSRVKRVTQTIPKAKSDVKTRPMLASSCSRKIVCRIFEKATVRRPAASAPNSKWASPIPPAAEKRRKLDASPNKIVWESELASMVIRFKTRSGPMIEQEMAMQLKTMIWSSSA